MFLGLIFFPFFNNQQYNSFLLGQRGITLGKPNIKVETVNKETKSLEEEVADVSTTTRMVKAMYSVSRPLSDSLEDCGEELLDHLKHKRSDKWRGLKTKHKNTLSKCYTDNSIHNIEVLHFHIQHDRDTHCLVYLWESQRI